MRAKKTWLVSDTHFGHKNIVTFLNKDGSKLRPFDTIEEHDDALVTAWNERVLPHDKVYHLGDVVINRKGLATVKNLHGDKVLLRGNHDIFKDQDYYDVGFRALRAYHVLNGIIMSHIPVHESQMERFGTNVHGHTHGNRVMMFSGSDAVDVRYHCVCMEWINFAPIELDDVFERIKAEGGVVGFKNGNGSAM